MTIKQVIKATCKIGWVTEEQIRGDFSTMHYCDARTIVSYLMYTECGLTEKEIAVYICRDLSNVYAIIKRHKKRLKSEGYKLKFERVLNLLKR